MGKSEKSLGKIVVSSQDKTTYLVFYTDLFTKSSTPEDRMHETNQKKPKCCSECESDAIVDLEVIGAEINPIFWLCLECDALYLQYELEDTMKKLEKASDVWTNHNDWGWREKDEFN